MKQQTPRAIADDLRKLGRFDEAAQAYAALWPDGDVWTGWGYAHCLRKLGKTPDAVEVARAVHELDPDFRFGRSVYAWSLYDQLRQSDQPELECTNVAESIVRLTADEEGAYLPTSPFVPTVLRMARAWAGKRRDLRALGWLERLDPSKLQKEELCRCGEDGSERRLASPRERYYGIRTHALERLGRWQECLDVATLALSDCALLHHDNDIWFARRVARAKLALGRVSEALVELQALLPRKPSTFLHTDIAIAAWQAQDSALAWKHALLAVAGIGDIGFKLTAVRLLAEVLWQRGDKAHAAAHLRLCIATRKARAWRESPELQQLSTAWAIDMLDGDAAVLLRDLQLFWKRWHSELTPRQVGEIVRMFPHGRAGFIRGTGGGDQYYFDTRDWSGRKAQPTAGKLVTFATRPGFDRKRQRATTVACDVRPAHSGGDTAS